MKAKRPLPLGLLWAWGAIALTVLFVMIGQSPHHLVYDERYYLPAVNGIVRYGISWKFLETLPGSAGPLHPIAFYLAQPLFGLNPPSIRFLNPLFLVGVILVLYRCAKYLAMSTPSLCALGLLAVPMTWVVAGMALTEMPALFFLSLFLLYFIKWNQSGKDSADKMAFLSGLFLTIAISGRQTFAVLSLIVPCAMMVGGRRDRSIAIFIATSLVVPLILFAAWGGLTPPSDKSVGLGISWVHGFLALSYAGLVGLLIAPAQYRCHVKSLLITTSLAVLIAWVIFPQFDAFPMMSVSGQFPHFPLLKGIMVFGFIFIGVWFLQSILEYLVKNRDPLSLSVGLGSLALLATSILQTSIFSSRYVEAPLPLLILLWRNEMKPTPFLLGRFIFGAGLGVLSLHGYYQS